MITCFNDWFVLNGNIFSAANFKLPEFSEIVLYEVIRVIDGVPIFLEDHLERLINSAKLKKVDHRIDKKIFVSEIDSLIKINQNIDGNIRYSLYFYKNEILRNAHYSKHEYPSSFMYENGVKLKSLKIERPEPNIKTIHSEIKDKTDTMLIDKSIYEIVLVGSNGIVTEGSRSNLFFIKNEILYTSPSKDVLIGITRERIISLCKKNNIIVKETPIPSYTLDQYDACFISGTSPKILPIYEIDNIKYAINNALLIKLINIYNKEIEDYIIQNI
jgi:branched-chain amino acid aminotransferase